MRRSETGFFAIVWRFNALAIAVASVVCLVLGAYAGYKIFTEETRQRRVSNVVNVGETVSEQFTLGSAVTIAGTPYVRAPLYREQTYSGSHYSKWSDQNAVNYLFLNVARNESRWLFDGAGQLVLESQLVFDKLKDAPQEERKPVALLYVIVEKDSNGDGRLTSKDAVAVTASAVDGTNPKRLLEGVDHLTSMQQISDDKVLLQYQKNGQTLFELYSVPSMERLAQTSIPRISLK